MTAAGGRRRWLGATGVGVALTLAGCGSHHATSPVPSRTGSLPVSVPASGSASTSEPGSGPSSTSSPGSAPPAGTSGRGGATTTPATASVAPPASHAPAPPSSGAPAGSTGVIGLDRPVGGFARVPGISGITTSDGVVSGFTLDYTAADGGPVSLSKAVAQLAAYLPAGSRYGATSTSRSCSTLQVMGAKHPANSTFCSNEANQAPTTYTASRIAQVTVADVPGL